MNEQDKQRCEEIQALKDAATPGSWKWEGDILITSAPEYLVLKPYCDSDRCEISTCVMPHDAALIAAAPEALTYLLDLVARQDAEIKRLTGVEKTRYCSICEDTAKDRDRLADACKGKDAELQKYRQAEAEGRLVKLPLVAIINNQHYLIDESMVIDQREAAEAALAKEGVE